MAKFLKDIVNDVVARGVTKSVHKEDKTVQVKMTKEEVEGVLRNSLDIMGNYLADNEKLYLIGFMNFEPKDYRAKNSKHPQTQEDMVIPAYRGVLSKPSDPLKEKLAAGHKRDHGA